ncbi:hypothetical protein PG2022B_1685 [Bifidobacterium animalis subsp. animalis]|nr:hypothetical protein PG2022B_1685 [Bifidobacterium animalis subsp. animalis]
MPSEAPADVTMTRRQFVPSTGVENERLVRMRRKSSAIGLPGSLIITGVGEFNKSSSGTLPIIGASISSPASSSSCTVFEKTSFNKPAIIPRIIPATIPTSTFRVHFGELGALGSCAASTTVSLMEESCPDEYRDFSMTLLKELAIELAILAACSASNSVTEIFMKAVLAGFVTVISLAKVETDLSKCKSSITGRRTTCVFTKAGYD